MHRPVFLILMRTLHHFDDAVFFHLDGHPVLHIGQEFIAEAVDHRHVGVCPEGGEDRPGAMPPVVEPMVSGRQSALPSMDF